MTKLGTTLRIARECASVACARTAATSHAPATYHAGPTNGATCGLLLRDDDNAVESAKVHERLENGGLIESGVAALDRGHPPDRDAGVERAAFARDDCVADVEGRVLGDVLDDDAVDVAARDSPPPPAPHDRRYAARVIGREDDGARERPDGRDASHHAVGREHAVVATHAGSETFVDR